MELEMPACARYASSVPGSGHMTDALAALCLLAN